MQEFLENLAAPMGRSERRLARKVVALLCESEGWIINEAAVPKTGQHSLGAARQYCGTAALQCFRFGRRRGTGADAQ
ncbi:MAG: transposase [Candidatus Dormibacteraceae bacterium]